MIRGLNAISVALSLVAAVGICSDAACWGAAPIEGDAALLQMLVDVQATNLTLFPRGELTAEVSEKFAPLDAEATVVWDGSRTYTRFRTKTIVQSPVPNMPGKFESLDSIQEGEMIEAPGVLMLHFPSLLQARSYVEHESGTGCFRELKLRPDQIWFSYEGVVNLKELISPTSTRAEGVKFVVKRDGPDRIVVERHFGGGSYISFVASLSSGGNIVSFETILSTAKNIWGKGTYSWDRDPLGRWYLRELRYEVAFLGDPQQIDRDFSLRVTKFNADPIIPSDRFEFSSFKVEDGTVVEEGLILGRSSTSTPGRRTYRVGKLAKPEANLSESQLNGLVEKLRAGGFAAPDRKSK
jgi:hypothetical protein